MLNKGNFDDYIYPFSLRFKERHLEDRFKRMKQSQLHELGARKMFILVFAIVETILIIVQACRYYISGEMGTFRQLVVNQTTVLTGIAGEFVLHRLNVLRQFRSFPIAISLYFVICDYDFRILPAPGILMRYHPAI
ncbi:MAG: hypothetical protein P4M11_11035 [Candidatus Pacebacteria bacterium]|nr:hypothetical protein [Candidatus Paceibacterota bacterium]